MTTFNSSLSMQLPGPADDREYNIETGEAWDSLAQFFEKIPARRRYQTQIIKLKNGEWYELQGGISIENAVRVDSKYAIDLIGHQILLKQNKQDDSLYTPDKTINGAINYLSLRASSGTTLGDDNSFDDVLMFYGIDSTTWQLTATGSGFDYFTTNFRKPGQLMQNIKGYINFASSGYKLKDFVHGPEQPLPNINETENLGIGNWDFYGHKIAGAQSLNTILKYRSTRNEKIVWRIGGGVNDVLLDNTVGNLPQDEITEIIFNLLTEMVLRIRKTYKDDSIILKMPNPMYARPYNPDFPSQVQYPTFGTNLTDDVSLINKWNYALRNAYLKCKGLFVKTIVLDTWEKVYGFQDASLPSTDHPFMSDSVHPNPFGYNGEQDELIAIFSPPKEKNLFQKIRADRSVSLKGGNPWDYYTNYFQDNPKYRLIFTLTGLTAGNNYIDIQKAIGEWSLNILGKPFYVVTENVGAQKISSYTAGSQGATTTRLTGVTPILSLQGVNKGKTYIYVDAVDIPTQDTYIISRINSLKPRDVYYGKITSSGNGYIDITFAKNLNRFSNKYLYNFNKGRLLIGGSISADISDLNTWSATRQGVSSNGVVRITKTGDFSTFLNAEVALVYDDLVNSPKSYEGILEESGAMDHTSGNVGRVVIKIPFPDGATINCNLTEYIASTVTVDVYSARNNVRTLIGTCSFTANNGASSSLTISTAVLQSTVFEFIITSNTSQANGSLVYRVMPI